MRLLISFAALFASVALLQLGSGGLGPFDALSGVVLGFTTTEIGLLGSAHFLGFFLGCWAAPRLLGAIGHSRAFAVFTAAGTISLIAHMVVPHPWAWAGMRVASGLCVAGCYTVIEAWLQAKVTNETRGRAMGTYRVVDQGASLLAQLAVSVLEPATYAGYNLLAILACAALLPLALTRAGQPEVPSAPRLRPMLAVAKSPLAAAAVVVAGLTSSAFRTVGPLHGTEVGLRPDQIGPYLAAFVAGGALAQLPAGWIADRMDRRRLLIWLSALAVASCAASATLAGASVAWAYATAALFGLITFPIYSVAAAHAHDQATSAERVELSAALMFLFALGAIGSPLAASTLIEAFGPQAMFWLIGGGHLLLALVAVARAMLRPRVEARTPYVWTPRTTFVSGRLFGRLRERDDPPREE
ncbi:MFS transporter [Jannaschia sp. Os4]|uniref:MFS transporter n=1 Tax=Jannaschia sp. Os4 TaxID=2807617 RepID=UPI0019397B68|nr:MFS transporter [Jannaschia sp. Os4]MBM2577698.1 MFS transporter [Jannaschia sp. Os4]